VASTISDSHRSDAAMHHGAPAMTPTAAQTRASKNVRIEA
jgi:hypothetical protein